MAGFDRTVLRMASLMDVVGGAILTLMMLTTVLDVVLRFFGMPITGTYELVYLGAAVVIGCAMPQTTRENGNVNVDMLLMALPRTVQKWMTVFTRLMGMGFFFFLGWNLFAFGTTLFRKGEGSLTLHVPIFPVVFILGICAFIECFVLLTALIAAVRGVSR